MSTIPLSGIEAFLYAEARALDDKDWDTWLSFDAPDASFWSGRSCGPARATRSPHPHRHQR